MRPIDADTLERMGYVLTRTYKQDKKTMVYETKKLSDVPSVELDKKGRWIPHHEENPLDGSRGGVTCSNCGWKTHNKIHLLMGCPYSFCPNCGCRMEGDEHE